MFCVRANSRALQTRQLKPTCSGTLGLGSGGLAGGVGAAWAVGVWFAGAAMAKAVEQDAQRARLPIRERGIASGEPHLGQATTAVLD